MIAPAFVKALFILFVAVGVIAPVVAWFERKHGAWLQDRVGANRAEIAGITAMGLFQPLADAIKLLAKQELAPASGNRLLHRLAPLLAAVPALLAFAVIPFGGVYRFGETTIELVVADLDAGLLYVFAIGTLAVYGTVLAGWSSRSPWSLLGGLRASALMISCAVALGFSAVGIFMVFETLRLSDMAIAQDATFLIFGVAERAFGVTLPAELGWLDAVRLPSWGIFLQPVAFGTFLTASMVGNLGPRIGRPTNGSEIVTDPIGDFTGARFGLFYLAEIVGVVVIAALMATIFLGGWSLPYLPQETLIAAVGRFFGTGFATGFCLLVHVVAFIAKLAAMIWLQVALRWALPRLRYDQLIGFCWKLLLPLALANIFVTGALILALEGSG